MTAQCVRTGQISRACQDILLIICLYHVWRYTKLKNKISYFNVIICIQNQSLLKCCAKVVFGILRYLCPQSWRLQLIEHALIVNLLSPYCTFKGHALDIHWLLSTPEMMFWRTSGDRWLPARPVPQRLPSESRSATFHRTRWKKTHIKY